MKLGRGLRVSARALSVHRGRTSLAAASVAIGVAAVLVTSALGQGARDEVLHGVATMGTTLLVVRPAQVQRLVARQTVRGRVTSLTTDDCREIRALSLVAEAAPGSEQRLRVKVGRRSTEALVLGTSPSFRELRSLRLSSGRFFETNDASAAQRVAVLGARVAATLFPARDPVGRTIRVAGQPFQVVGVLAARGVLADGSDEDGNVFVPILTALRRVSNTTWLTSIFVGARDPDHLDEAAAQVRSLLRDRHGLGEGKPDDFDIQNQAKLLATRAALADSLALLASGLAGVSLLVGGAGILALMLLSVRERTCEIGLRMAVGARTNDVFLQFLLEATALALAGWLAGAAAGGIAATVLALVTRWPVGVPTDGVLATLVITVLTGAVFGSLPARKAARLTPIEALRAA
jgi:putative ABC transport system permease protein